MDVVVSLLGAEEISELGLLDEAELCLSRDNLDEKRVASFRNAPERAGHCLI
jgi:hypothetical protein